MIAPEEDGEEIASRVASSATTSPIAIYETVLAVCRVRKAPVAEALLIVSEFLQRAGIKSMAIDGNQHVLALGAFERYGKGTGHPARLNMGDCFAYAMAKQAGVPLLYKGDDFALTDLA
jgi:ribonuclease VapC